MVLAVPGKSQDTKQYRIGVFALVPFTQLQDMLSGFKKATTSCGLVEGKNTTYFVDFAQGNNATLQLIAKRDLDNNVDLFLALDTPSMVTMAGLTKTVPIVAVAPTYPVASGVVKSLDQPGTNVTGGTDYIDPKVTLDKLQQALPSVKTLGMIYNPSEQNSAQFQAAIRPPLSSRGIKLVELTVTNTGEVQTAARGLIGRVDAILIGADNTVVSAVATVASVAKSNKIPVVSYIAGTAAKGALLDLGVDYEFLGERAGRQACDILLHGGNPATMPFTRVEQPIQTINTETAKAIGVELPESILKTGVKVP
jgi:putative ABC transport system substrate-binding protein